MMREPKADAMFSPSGPDFEAFPPTVKRKYFSTLERLRYAQGQPPQITQASPTSQVPQVSQEPAAMHVFRPKSAGTPKQKSAHLRRPSLFRLSTRHVKEHIPESPSLAGKFPHNEAQWYQNLPEKIKRNHFTLEERNAFARKESVVPDAAEELFYRLGGRYGNRSLPSLSSCSEAGSVKEEVLKTPMDMNEAIIDTFELLESDSPLDPSLDEYHNHVTETANVPRIVSPTAQKAHQILSLNSASAATQRSQPSTEWRTAAKASSGFPYPLDSLSTDDSPTHFRGRSISDDSISSSAPNRTLTPKGLTLLERRSLKRASSHQDVPSVPQIDPEVSHVSDPAARLKLKLYLSSAAKFDEALEFGFPSLGATTPSQSGLPSNRLSGSTSTTHRRSLSVGAMQSLHTMHSVRSMRRSVSTSRSKRRSSMAIGTTFFYDDYESEDDSNDGETDTVRESASIHNAGMESDATAVDFDLPQGIAELPGEPVTPKSRPFVSQSQHEENKKTSSPLNPVQPTSSVSPTLSSHMPRLSRSISLKPRLRTQHDITCDTALPPVPQSAKDYTILSRKAVAELKSPQTPLKPWVEPSDMFGEREMTLRLTLTRKDLRADESLIYPEDGMGSWDSQTYDRDASLQVRDPSIQGKWKFWSKRR